MQFHSTLTSQSRRSLPEGIPYSAEAMKQDMRRIRDVWASCQGDRDRNAIYAYLSAVYGLIAWWSVEGREIDRAQAAVCLQHLGVSDREDAFSAIIRCTADPEKVDKRTRSKWSRAMRYAAEYKDLDEPLDQFIKRKGGINECAARWSRRLRRLDEIKHRKRVLEEDPNSD